jgi:hypothetical protein
VTRSDRLAGTSRRHLALERLVETSEGDLLDVDRGRHDVDVRNLTVTGEPAAVWRWSVGWAGEGLLVDAPEREGVRIRYGPTTGQEADDTLLIAPGLLTGSGLPSVSISGPERHEQWNLGVLYILGRPQQRPSNQGAVLTPFAVDKRQDVERGVVRHDDTGPSDEVIGIDLIALDLWFKPTLQGITLVGRGQAYQHVVETTSRATTIVSGGDEQCVGAVTHCGNEVDRVLTTLRLGAGHFPGWLWHEQDPPK